MDARDYRATPIVAPMDQERSQHYSGGSGVISRARAGRRFLDRSWYGRASVERVEKASRSLRNGRALFRKINESEEDLEFRPRYPCRPSSGSTTKDEQYRRFKERETVSYKKWKLTAEDWRNRAKWERPRRQCTRWSNARAPCPRHGRWSRATTRTTLASRSSAPRVKRCTVGSTEPATSSAFAVPFRSVG